MSYQGDDRWEAGNGGSLLSISCKTLKELKKEIEDYIKEIYIDKAKNQYDVDEYEITKVKIVIRKKRENRDL